MARVGEIAFLTTEPPGSREHLVGGAFRISKLVEDPGQETKVYGDSATVLDDMLDYRISFWKYHRNPTNPDSIAWSTGLFGYVVGVAALGILEKYIAKKQTQGGDASKARRWSKH